MKKVICVHGIFNTGKVFGKMCKSLVAEGYEVCCVTLTPKWGNGDLVELAKQLKVEVEAFLEEEEKGHFVAFSMGGLVTRYYLQRLCGLDLAESLVTISTPHQGTMTSHALPLVGCKQMKPESDFLKDLNADVGRLEVLKPLSLWTKFDLMIVPAKSSLLGVGRTKEFPVPIHAMMVKNGEVIKDVVAYLNDFHQRP